MPLRWVMAPYKAAMNQPAKPFVRARFRMVRTHG